MEAAMPGNREVLAVDAPGAGSSSCAVWGTARPHNGTTLGSISVGYRMRIPDSEVMRSGSCSLLKTDGI